MVTKKAFRAYLEANQEREFMRCNPWSCPLAGCLSQFYDEVSVTSSEAEYRSRANKRYSHHELPVWAQEFVSRVDSKGSKTPLTGAEALALLGEK